MTKQSVNFMAGARQNSQGMSRLLHKGGNGSTRINLNPKSNRLRNSYANAGFQSNLSPNRKMSPSGGGTLGSRGMLGAMSGGSASGTFIPGKSQMFDQISP